MMHSLQKQQSLVLTLSLEGAQVTPGNSRFSAT